MQASRWRLNFYSSRPYHRQLRQLWADCNIKCDEEIDSLRARASVVFLDAMMLTHDNCVLDQHTQSSIVDELSGDLISICCALVYAVKYCRQKLTYGSTIAALPPNTAPSSNHSKPVLLMSPSQALSSTDESIIWSELMNKALLAAELLCTMKGSSVCMKDLLATSGTPFISYVVGTFDVMTCVSELLILVRILKVSVFASEAYMAEMVQIEGFRRLAEKARDIPEPALIFQIVGLQGSYLEQARLMYGAYKRSPGLAVLAGGNTIAGFDVENSRSRACSTSSSGYPLRHSSGGLAVRPSETELPTTIAAAVEEDASSSIAGQGLHIAFNFVSELLKLAPLTAAWFDPKGRHAGSSSRPAAAVDYLSAISEEQLVDASTMIPMAMIEVETERVRLSLLSLPCTSSSSSPMSSTHSSSEEEEGLFDLRLAADIEGGTSRDAAATDILSDESLQQSMQQIVLLAINRAVSPTEAVETLMTLQSMLIGNPYAQGIFSLADGYTKLSYMLIRIEENLALLVRCSEGSKAAAAGGSVEQEGGVPSKLLPPQAAAAHHLSDGSPHISNIASQNQPINNDPLGAYYAFPQGEFDSYYSTVMMVLMNLLLDDAALTVFKIHPVSHLPYFPVRCSEMKNLQAASLLTRLVGCPFVGLNVVVVRMCFGLIRAHSPNVIALELTGVISALIEQFVCIALSGNLNQSSSPNRDAAVYLEEGEEEPARLQDSAVHSPGQQQQQYSPIIVSQLFSDMLVTLEMVAVATGLRDQSMIALFSVVLLHLVSHDKELVDCEDDESIAAFGRCHNCETEASTLQCLHDGCLNDNCFRLCDECDKVFHKSAAKKSHIRIPITPEDRQCAATCIEGVLEEGGCLRAVLRAATSKLNDACARPLRRWKIGRRAVALSSSSSSSDAATAPVCAAMESSSPSVIGYKECVSCILLAGIRGLLDDGKVRRLDAPYVVYPLLLRTMRTIVSCRASTASAPAADVLAWPTILSDRLCLSSLVDNGRDGRMMGGLTGPHSRSIDYNLHPLYAQPPEVHGSSPRRIQLCLLTQCISRFLVHKPDLSSGSRLPLSGTTQCQDELSVDISELYAQSHVTRPGCSRRLDHLMQGTCIALLLQLGIDAVFAHICTSASSSYVQVTSVDKQFIAWLLRETIVTARGAAAEGCCSPHMQDRLYNWLGWMAKGDVNRRLHTSTGGAASDLSSRLRGPLAVASSASISMKDGLLMPSLADSTRLSAAPTIVAFKGGVIINCAAHPPSVPSIPLLLRLVVLQELILLMSSDLEAAAAAATSSRLPPDGYLSLTYRSQIPLEPAWTDSNGPTWTMTSYENKAAVPMTSHAANQFKRSSQRRHRSSSHSHHSSTRDHHHIYSCEKSVLLYSAMTCTRSAKLSMVRLGFVELFSDLVMGDLRSVGIVHALQDRSSPHHSGAAAGRSVEPLSDLEREDWWMAFAAFVQLLQGCDEAKERLLESKGVEKTIGFVLFLQEFITKSAAPLDAPSSSSCLGYSPILSCLVVELCTRCGQFSPPDKAFVAALARYPRVAPKTAEAPPPVGRPDHHLEQLFLRSSAARCLDHHPDLLVQQQQTALAPVYFTQSRLTNILLDVCSARPLSFMQGSFRHAFAGIATGTIHTPLPSSQSLLRSGKTPLMTASSADNLSEFRVGGIRLSVESESNASSVGTSSLLLGRRFAQLQMNSSNSYEHDSRWETDSLASSTLDSTARSCSLHSSHSLAVLSQALLLHGDTPPPSISGDTTAIISTTAVPKTKQLSRTSSAEHMQKPSAVQPTISGLFPPTAGDGDYSAPSVYVPLLRKFDGGGEELATSVLLLLHHALLIRSSEGSSVVEVDDAAVGEKDSPSLQRSSDHYDVIEDKADLSSAKLPEQQGANKTAARQQGQPLTHQIILRKHLSMFVPSTMMTMTSSSPVTWTKRELPHCPPYSRLQIASPDSCELLVSVAVVSAPSDQTTLFSAISHLIDGNPANAFKFVQRPAICISMIQMLPHLQEQCQQMVGHILSQSLRYSVQMPALRELISAVRYSKMSPHDVAPTTTADDCCNATTDHHQRSSPPRPPEDCSSSGSQTLLFVMGRTADRTAPDAFLHFDSSCPFVAKVELPPIVPLAVGPSSAPLTDTGVTICAWIRLGTLAHSQAVSLLQLYTEDNPNPNSSSSSDRAHVLVNAYFRVVYKLSKGRSSSDYAADSDMRSQQRVCKRVVQLCFGFRKTIHPLLVPSEGPSDPSFLSETTGVSNHHRWHAAVEQLSSESCFPSEDEQLLVSDPSSTASHQGAIAKLANTINHYAIPDAIVELDWTEMGEWHLLCLSIGPDAVGCSVDGMQKPVAYWTPLGYRYGCTGERGSASAEDITTQPTTTTTTTSGASSSPYCDFSKVTKDSPLKVILGGLQYECASWQMLQSHARRTSPLLHVLSSLMAGFAGSVGEVAVLSGAVGPPDAFALHCMARAGPGQGLRDLKVPRLSELTAHHMIMMSNNLTAAAGGSPGVFPISLSDNEKADHALHDSPPSFIYSSNITMNAVALAKRDIITITSKGKEAAQVGLRFSESVQVHRTSSAASTLKHIGGLRLLYPLLVVDRARLVAALRMMGSILLSSPEAYKDFQSSDTDKVVLFCALQQPSLITLETLQVLFDLICDPAPPNSSPSLFPRGAGPLPECSEVIHRQTLLDLLVLIVLSSRTNCQLARSAVDWMREICDDEIHNCQKLLKTTGLLPVLIMLSVWDVCGADPHAVKSHTPESQHRSSNRSSSEAPTAAEATIDPIVDSHHSETTAAELASLANKYKLQVSCYRLVKLLITGTAGEVDLSCNGRVAGSSQLQLLSHTVTDFSAAHLSVLLSFIATTSSMSEDAVTCKDSRSSSMAAPSRCSRDSRGGRDKLRQLYRLKRLVFGTFSGLPTLEGADITAPHYWLLSSTFIALDAVLSLASGALQGALLSMLRSAFAPNVLNAIILQLMGSESAEIRERAIYLLIVSVSGIDGKLDLKQVSIFERMHGFQCMAEQLSTDPDGCTGEIVEALFMLIYWCRSSTSAFKFTSSTYTTTSGGFFSHSTSHATRYYPADQLLPSRAIVQAPTHAARANADRGAVNTSIGVSPIAAAGDSACKEATSTAAPAAAVSAPAANSGNMLSMLWGSSPSSSGVKGSAPIIPTSLHADGSSSSPGRMELGCAVSLQMKAIDCAPNEGLAQEEEEHSSQRGEQPATMPHTSDAVKVDSLRPVSDESSSRPRSSLPIPERPPPANDDQLVLLSSTVGTIAVPQCLEVLFRVLHNAKSSDQVTRAFHRLESSVCCHLYSSSRFDRQTNYFSSSSASDSSKHARATHESSSGSTKASQQLFSNMESIFAQRDWFVCLCDLLRAFKSNSNSHSSGNGCPDEHLSVLSLSENESTGCGTHHVSHDCDPQYDMDYSYEDSEEDSNSCMSSESVGDDLSRTTGGGEDHHHHHPSGGGTNTAHQFCAPVYRFVCKLITHDMTSPKVGPTRRWNELFRISVPELRDVQETILMEVLGAMQNIAKLCADMVTVLNLFKNFAMLLDQALERADLSLLFCVKVIHSLQALTYNCPPEIRPRLKETALLEVRKSYVVRCLLEHHADYYAKVAALHEISSSLQSYVSLQQQSYESKPISDAQVVMIVLGIFVEACEDLEFLLSGIDIDLDCNAASFDYCTAAVMNAKESSGRCGSPALHSSSVNDRLLILLEVLEAIILCIQNCVFNSKECQRCVSKLVTNITADPLSHLANALLRSFDRSYRQRDASSHPLPVDLSPSSGFSSQQLSDATINYLIPTDGSDCGATRQESLVQSGDVDSATSSKAAVHGTHPVSYSWWGWSGTSTGDAAVAVPVERVDSCSIEGGQKEDTVPQDKLPPEEPWDARSFIRWFCAYEQREVQSSFRIRVLTEIRSTQRVVDKLRERPAQRFARSTRLAQEKLLKDRLQGSKATKEALAACRAASSKVILKFQRDVKVCISTSIAEKCEVGRSIFQSATAVQGLSAAAESGHPAMGAGDSDRQLNSAAAAALDEEHSSMGLFRNEMMLMHTAGVADQCIGRGEGGTRIRALAALRGVFRANELRFK